MGFDIYGLKPSGQSAIKYPEMPKGNSKAEMDKWKADGEEYWGKVDTIPGTYFRNNVWWWRPLWTYVQSVAKLDQLEKIGEYNDGHVNEDEALHIADVLDKEIADGKTDEYAWDYMWKLVHTPDIKCSLCNGTGKREDMPEQDKCNACHGLGHERPWEAHYPFNVINVREFAEFCRHSGGFDIS